MFQWGTGFAPRHRITPLAPRISRFRAPDVWIPKTGRQPDFVMVTATPRTSPFPSNSAIHSGVTDARRLPFQSAGLPFRLRRCCVGAQCLQDRQVLRISIGDTFAGRFDHRAKPAAAATRSSRHRLLP